MHRFNKHIYSKQCNNNELCVFYDDLAYEADTCLDVSGGSLSFGANGQIARAFGDNTVLGNIPREYYTLSADYMQTSEDLINRELIEHVPGIKKAVLANGISPELLEQTIGLRRTAPFYAMLFGRPAVRYARGVQRDSYARIDQS